MNTSSRFTGIAPAVALTVLALTACSTSSDAATSATASQGGATPAGVTTQGTQIAQHLDVTGFAALAATPGTVVLDVRTPEEFTTGHLAGARNMDFRAANFSTRVAALDHGTTYAVYCHSGNRSGQALQVMTDAGFTHVADLIGGITAWSTAGKTVTTG